MVHQVLADQSRAVGDRALAVADLRHQQEPRRLDRVGGNHVDRGDDTAGRGGLARRFEVRLVPDVVDLAHAPVRPDNHFAGDGAIQELDVSAIERFVERNGGIILGLDRADRNAVGVACAGAAISVGLRVARGRRADDPDRPFRIVHSQRPALDLAELRQRIGDPRVDQRGRDSRHRIGIAGGVRNAEPGLVAHVRRHAEFALRLAVPTIQVLVADRPVHKLAVAALHLEVVDAESQRSAEPMSAGAAGDALVGAGEGLIAVLLSLHQIALLRVLPFVRRKRQHGGTAGVDRAGVGKLAQQRAVFRRKQRRCVRALRHLEGGGKEPLHIGVDVGRNFRPGLEDHHLLAARCQVLCDQCTGDAGADDRNVIAFAFVGHHAPPMKSGRSGLGLRCQ